MEHSRVEHLQADAIIMPEKSFMTGEERSEQKEHNASQSASKSKPFIDTLGKLEKEWIPEIKRDKLKQGSQKSVPEKQPEEGQKEEKPKVTDEAGEGDDTHKSSPAESKIISDQAALQEKEKALAREIKRRMDNQHYSSALKQTFLSAKARILVEKEEGEISDIVADRLIAILDGHHATEPEGLGDGLKNSLKEGRNSSHQEEGSHAFSPYFKAITQDVIQNYLDVSEDDSYENKIRAFNTYLSEATAEEMEELSEDLKSVNNNPMALLKKMLKAGESFQEQGYSLYEKAGGLRSLIQSHQEALAAKDKLIEKHLKEIDKKDKILLKYEHYDKGTYRLREAGEDGEEKPEVVKNPDTLAKVNPTIRSEITFIPNKMK
jgi:uncharacterized protein YciU (UPF0263 family)